MTLTFEADPYMVTVNQPATYLGQRSFRLEFIVRTHEDAIT